MSDSEDTVLQPAGTQAQYADILGATNRYRIIRHIGRGGMGAVVLAEDTRLGRQVAIKKPLRESLESEDARRRFEGEGRAAAKLNSPYLCRVIDVAVWDGLPCLVMEYVAGESLSSLLRQKGPFSIDAAVDLVIQLADGLSEAHSQGVIHRDLKPGNVIVTPGGKPVVVDFGLAWEDQRSYETRTGTLLGTFAYMSPEQAEAASEMNSPATDIYSLGVILYELLTGRTPYRGTPTEILAQFMKGEPILPPSSISHHIDEDLNHICVRALARRIGDRFQSMKEMGDSLRGWREMRRTTPVEQPSSSTPPLVCDENTQFTVLRPKALSNTESARQLMLVFVHPSEPLTAVSQEGSVEKQIEELAREALGDQVAQYRKTSQDPSLPVPRDRELILRPSVDGIRFEPEERRFVWRGVLHEERFRLRLADSTRDVLRGRLLVLWGTLVIAEVPLAFPVKKDAATSDVQVDHTRRFRRIFASFSPSDAAVVQQCQMYATALGDSFVTRQSATNVEEGIRSADLFQLFWSSRAMSDDRVRSESAFAVNLRRPDFVRGVFWEMPFPQGADAPPKEIPQDAFTFLGVSLPSGDPPAFPGPERDQSEEQTARRMLEQVRTSAERSHLDSIRKLISKDSQKQPQVVLMVTSGSRLFEKRVVNQGQSITVGRSAVSEWSFPMDGLMRDQHFEVRVSDSACVISDTRHDTRVNGMTVAETTLYLRDAILAGGTHFVVQSCSGLPERPPPPSYQGTLDLGSGVEFPGLGGTATSVKPVKTGSDVKAIAMARDYSQVSTFASGDTKHDVGVARPLSDTPPENAVTLPFQVENPKHRSALDSPRSHEWGRPRQQPSKVWVVATAACIVVVVIGMTWLFGVALNAVFAPRFRYVPPDFSKPSTPVPMSKSHEPAPRPER